jgi:hypothetical protein
VFFLDGLFDRHIGLGVLRWPSGVACADSGELVVADTGNRCVRLFGDTDELLLTFGDGDFTGVAVHGTTVFAQDCSNYRCVVWS